MPKRSASPRKWQKGQQVDIEAIQTTYAGVTFRSKLEATWARFFDTIGISWEYEPTALPGWIPDFLVDGWWLAEVKPFPVIGKNAVRHEPFAKAIRSFDTLLLGDGPGDGLGLLVRRMVGGDLFVRHLLAFIESGPTKLVPALAVPRWDTPLTAIWRALVEADPAPGLKAAPFAEVVVASVESGEIEAMRAHLAGRGLA